VAKDLRIVVSALRISASLERMGDMAEHLAQLARYRFPEKVVPKTIRPTFKEMGALDVKMAKMLVELLKTEDTSPLPTRFVTKTTRWMLCTFRSLKRCSVTPGAKKQKPPLMPRSPHAIWSASPTTPCRLRRRWSILQQVNGTHPSTRVPARNVGERPLSASFYLD
jgi:hypothetical protein